MTAREIFQGILLEEGEEIYLIKFLFVSAQGFKLEDKEIPIAHIPEFYESNVVLLKNLWEGLLSTTDARLVGMEGFSDDEVIEEVNRVTGLLRNYLNHRFNVQLPEKRIEKSSVN